MTTPTPKTLADIQVGAGDTVNSQYFSELMEDYSEERLLSNHSGIQAVLLENGVSAVLTIGKDGNLYLLLQERVGPDGWSQFCLTTDPGSGDSLYGTVTSFGVSQVADDGTSRIAFGAIATTAADDDPAANPQLLVSSSQDLGTYDFSNFDPTSFFSEVGLTLTSGKAPVGGELSQVSLTDSVAIVSWQPSDTSEPVCFGLNSENESQPLVLSEARSIQHVAAGQIATGATGAFVLYTNSASVRALQYVPFEGGGTISFPLDNPAEEINTFTTALDSTGNSQLYVGGSGIYQFDTLLPLGVTVATSPTALLDAHAGQSITKLVGAIDPSDGGVTLWSQMTIPKSKDDTQSAPGLFMLTNQSYQFNSEAETESVSVGDWNKPMQLLADISDFCPVKGASFLNQLFYISLGTSKESAHLRHFYQAAVSSVWNDRPVPVQGTNEIRNFFTYTNSVKFTCADPNKTFAGVKASLLPSSSLFAIVNHEAVALSPGAPTEITLDATGLVTIVAEMSSLSGADVSITADFLDDPYEMALTQKIPGRLRKKLTPDPKDPSDSAGQRLMNAQRLSPGGGMVPLFPTPGDFDSTTYEAIATGILNFLNVGDYVSGATTKPPSSFSMTLSPGNATMGSDNDCRAFLESVKKSEGVLGDIGHAIGDVVHWVESFVEDVVHLAVEVVEDAVQLTIKIGEEILNFVIDAVEQIFDIIEWMFKALKIAFEVIVALIGLIFAWGEVEDTKNAIKQLIVNLVTTLQTSADTLSSDLTAWIDKHEPSTAQVGGAFGLQGYLSAAEASGGLWDATFPEMFSKTETDITIDPKQQWVIHKLPALAGTKISIPSGDDQLSIPPILKEILEQLEEFAKALEGNLGSAMKSLKQFLEGDLSLGDLVAALAQDLEGALFELLEFFVEIFTDVVDAGFAFAKEILSYPIDIPFFSAFYKKILSGDDLTPLDFVSLVFAVPVTLSYKMEFKVAPIGDGTNQITAAEFATVPASLFALPVGDSNQQEIRAVDSEESAEIFNFLCDTLIATTRAVRCVTYTGITTMALIPPEAEAADFAEADLVPAGLRPWMRYAGEDEGGKKGEWKNILPEAQWTFVLVDGVSRTGGMWFSLLQASYVGNQPTDVMWKNCLYSGYFPIAWVLNLVACPYFTKADPVPPEGDVLGISKDARKFYLRVIGGVDGFLVTVLGSWSAYDTSQRGDGVSGASISSQISMEVFQIPAILSPPLNALAPWAIDIPYLNVASYIAAVGVDGIRLLGLISGTVSEGFVAYQVVDPPD